MSILTLLSACTSSIALPVGVWSFTWSPKVELTGRELARELRGCVRERASCTREGGRELKPAHR